MTRGTLTVVLVSLTALVATTDANAYSRRVKSACKGDFYRFCPSYKIGSSKLRSCMRSAGGNISRRCVDALANAGEVPRKYHSRFRRR